MYSVSPTALAAIAPENPATNDVQPVRNAASGPVGVAQIHILAARPRPQRREFGVRHRAGERQQRRRASTTPSNAVPDDTRPATMIGTKKMPPPMTLATTMAAASNGPRRRSSVTSAGRGEETGAGCVHG